MSMLNYDEIAILIQDIINMIGQFPDKFQPILLEVLLADALKATKERMILDSKPTIAGISREFILPINVRAFLIQYNLDESLIEKLFYIENNQISPIWQIKTTRKSVAQIQVALLIALENALKTGNFEFSYEDVRNRCKNLLLYDGTNFSSHFRTIVNTLKV